jgi:hypothetical protein
MGVRPTGAGKSYRRPNETASTQLVFEKRPSSSETSGENSSQRILFSACISASCSKIDLTARSESPVDVVTLTRAGASSTGGS